jgi:paraquat-inducible protein B
MSKKANTFSIGLFVIAAFVLGILTFLFFGSTNLHRDTVTLIATFRGSTNGLREGAKVKAYGVEVGVVRQIKLHRMERTSEVVIPVLMEIDLDHVGSLLGHSRLTDQTRAECLAVLEQDAHATLQLDSFVTGLLYVEIIFSQSGEGFILESERFSGYRAMPTLPTEMDVFIKALQNIAANLGDTDIVSLVEETKATVVDIRTALRSLELEALRANVDALLDETRTLVSSPELTSLATNLSKALESFQTLSESVSAQAGNTFAQLNRALGELESASAGARTWLDPSNALYNEALQALDEISGAARSLRILAEYLERNPNALITGKPAE